VQRFDEACDVAHVAVNLVQCKMSIVCEMCTNSHSTLLPCSLIPGGVIPYDGVPLEQEVTAAISVTVIFSILATAGIVFAVACLVFNCIFRRRK